MLEQAVKMFRALGQEIPVDAAASNDLGQNAVEQNCRGSTARVGPDGGMLHEIYSR